MVSGYNNLVLDAYSHVNTVFNMDHK